MSWTERQLAMLREMGISQWYPLATPQAEHHVGSEVALLTREASEVVVDDEGSVDGRVAASSRVREGVATGTQPQAPSARPPTPEASPVARAPAPADAAARVASPAPKPTPVALRVPQVAVPPEVATLDWTALRETVAVCTACKLCEGRRQTVFGVGHERAHWMIVGEAPGEHEDLSGEPFVGKAGQLLDNMLAAIGLTRAESTPDKQVFIANTLKCRPPGNRNPEPAEMARCEPYLMRQIELVQPKIILAMGRFALQSLLRSDEPVGRLRGRVHEYRGVPLVATYHPAYLLRNLPDKAKAWDDLCLAMDTMEKR
ncbi:MAG: dpo [Rhizobacter sp.]|nr:dpo [Rhizobacter sp.]